MKVKWAVIVAVVIALVVAAVFLSRRIYTKASLAETEEGRQYAEETMVAVMGTWDVLLR